MLSIFHVILYQPIFNLFVFLYNIIPGHDVGLVILAITVLVRLVLYPFTSASIKSQRALQDLQPKMAVIKQQYATDKQKQTQAIMELYKNNKVNPLASCLPMLIQLPILIALYKVLQDGLHSKNLTESLYSFISNPGTINQMSFYVFNLAKPNYVLAVLAGAAQYLQARTLSRKNPPTQAGEGSKDEALMATMNKQMLYFMPVLTVLIGLNLPAGLTLYWFFGTLLMALQQMWLFKGISKNGTVIEGEIVK